MTKRIIYKNEEGCVSIVIVPEEERLKLLVSAAQYEGTCKVADAVYRDETDQEFYTRVALKDVPTGTPYKIIDVTDLPSDRTFRAAWTVDETLLTDGVGADYGAGSLNNVTAWNEDGTSVLQTTEETQ